MCVCVCVCGFCIYLCVSISGWLLLRLFLSFQALPAFFFSPYFFSFFQWKEHVCLVSHVWLVATPWTAVCMDPSVHGDSPSKNIRGGCYALLQGDLPNPGTEPRSPAFQADSLSTEPPEKPKNTGVGRLSLLQVIFPTQGLNQGFLHCRRILYQLSCRERTYTFLKFTFKN